MFTVDEYRDRYARYSSRELLDLMAIEPQCLTAEARVALAEESTRRGLELGKEPVETVAIATEQASDDSLLVIYPKAHLGNRLIAHIVDRIIGIGPLIMAALFRFLFHIGPQSPFVTTLNMLATMAWAFYYGFTKDARPNGQSIGKKMCHIMVIGIKTDRPCTLGQSIVRSAVPFLLGIIPFFGLLVEPFAVLENEAGRRLGDKAADTQVVDVSVYESAEHQLGR
jgi:uncharacterized RDD family membrane protein YckC